jgi:hypothetical protein
MPLCQPRLWHLYQQTKFMKTYNQERDALAAGIADLRRHIEHSNSPPEPPLVRYRVTALLDSGASLDCGVHQAHSVPQLISQARRSLSPNALSQVVNWRVDEVKDESPPAQDEVG